MGRTPDGAPMVVGPIVYYEKTCFPRPACRVRGADYHRNQPRKRFRHRGFRNSIAAVVGRFAAAADPRTTRRDAQRAAPGRNA